MQKYLLILLLFLLPTTIFSKTDNLVSDTKQTQLTALLSLVSNISETVHSLQQERGASCGFVSSNGKKFRSKLDSIKVDSDLKIKSLLINFNTNKTLLNRYFSSIEYDNLNTKFNELYLLRDDVKNLKMDFSKVYSKYTQLIAFLLLNISDISDKPKDEELRDKLYTYSILLMYKESIGQKRAALSALFSQKVFSKEIYEYFLTSDTQEKIYLKTFLHSVDKNIKDLYYSNLDNNSVIKVREYEKLALDKLNGKVIDVNPLEWFKYVTIKINLIRGIELHVFDNVLILVNKLNNVSPNTDNKELNIAFDVDNPPYMFGKTSSKGIEADLVKKIFQLQDYKVNIHQMTKQNMQKLLDTNSKFDAVASVSDIGDGIYYSDKYSLYENLVITRKSDNITINSLDDLAKYNFVSWRDAYNDLGETFYKYFNPKDGLYRSSYHDRASQKEQIKLFFNKKIDVIVVDKMVFKWYKLDLNNKEEYTFHKIFPPATNSVIGFKNEKIRDIFNKGLKEIKKSGRYQEIVNFYLTQDIQPLLRYSNIIADISGRFMFSAEPEELKKILIEFFKHPDILHIEIFNKTINSNFISLYKKDGKIIDAIDTEDMDGYRNFPSIKKDIYYSNEGNPLHVGRVKIFYKKEFDNKNGVLIPNLNHFIDLDKNDLQKIRNSYDKFELNTKIITLSNDEKKWIQTHPIIRFTGDPNWLPFEAFDTEGNYIGIVSDYLKKIENLTGIKFEKIATKSWSDSVELSQTKKVDILSETTESNRKYLTFTKPYIKNDMIIVMDKEHNYVDGIKAIKNKKIAMIKDYGYVKQIEDAYPDISFIKVESIQDGLSAVSTGKVDALVCTFALGTYTITSMGISNIKIVGKTKFFTTLGLGVRNDYPILVDILNKAIDSITQQEHNEIFNRWIQQDYIEKVDYALLYKVGGGAFILILMFVFWNRKMATEIDKRKIAEEKIKESQARFSTLFDASPDSIAIIDKNGFYVDCNIATTKLFGVDSKEEFIGTKPELYSPLKQPSGKLSTVLAQSIIESTFKEGKQIFEWVHHRIDTQVLFNAEVILSTIILNNEPHMYAVVRDITDRKLLEDTIKQNNDHMTFVSQNANLGFWNFNPQIGDLFVNDIFVTMLGYDPKDVLKNGYHADMFKPFKDGLTFWKQLLHPDDVERTTKILAAHINGETDIYKVDYRMRRADGSWMWSTAIGKIAQYDEDGKPIRFNGVNIDIDEQKKAQEEIEYQQQQFTSMVSNVPGVIYRCLLDEHWTMLYISDEIQRLSGYPASDYLNNSVRTFADIIHPDDSEYVAQYIQKQIDNKKPYIVDYRIIHKNGDVLWVRGEGQALWSNDNIGWLDGAIFDISSQKEAQKELEISKLKLDEEKNFIASIISSSQDALIVIDKNSIITTWNKSATTIFGYTKEEMIKQTIRKIIPHKFRELHTQGVNRVLSNGEQKLLGKGTIEIEGLHKNGTIIPIDLALNTFTINNEIFFSANIRDISERKELIDKINSEKQFTQTLLDSQEQLIITTDGKTLISANKTFLNFYAIDSIEKFTDKYNVNCVCDTFNTKAPEGYLQIMMGDETWIDYVISRSFGVTHRVMITRDNKNFIFSVSAAKLPGDKGLKSAIFTNITEMENAKQEIEAINRHTKESIEYASLIQGALIPDNKIFNNYFQDYFTIWHPKDTVGGDIYLFEELRDKDESLLMVIDCTGHGVPGAFVTMLVKAIERQVISKINNDLSIEVSPAWILNHFNRHMKQLLKQDSADSISNAGFDGGIIYYNKEEKLIKFAGAETPLFYVEDEELKVIKGNRYSVGYKKCDMDYEYKEHTLEVKEGMRFYLTTDGYLDQNGGDKSFPFGKKRFQNIIKESYQESMPEQKEIFLDKLKNYQDKEETNDDVTLIGFKI